MSILKRYTQGVAFDVRKAGDGDNAGRITTLAGLASRTGTEYVLFVDNEWRERWVELIMPGAFRDVLNDDVRVLINHDDNKVLGRTAAGTAKIWESDEGLNYQWDNDSRISYAADLERSIERGDITQSSFGFSLKPDGYEWVISTDEDGWTTNKHIIKPGGISKLWDVSPVTYPANPDTSVIFNSIRRSLDEWKKHHRGGNNTHAADSLNLLRRGIEAKSRHLEIKNY